MHDTAPSRLRSIEIAKFIANELAEGKHSSSRGDGTLATGTTGDALLFDSLYRVTGAPKWARLARRSLSDGASFCANHLGLFVGLPGVLMAATYLGRFGDYHQFQQALVDRILALADCDVAPYPSLHGTDLISGVTGFAIAASYYPQLRGCASKCTVSYMDELKKPFPWTRSDGASVKRDYGMAHGLAASCAATSLLKLREAGYFVDLLTKGMEVDNSNVCWPLEIGQKLSHPPASWCYGSVGIAMALGVVERHIEVQQISGAALFDQVAYKSLTDESLDLSLCHGIAGTAVASLMFEGGVLGLDFTALRGQVVSEILDRFDPTVSGGFGFHGLAGRGERRTLAFLDGAGGVAVSLLTLTGQIDPGWAAVLGGPRPSLGGAPS
jgi:hypothetical protein